MTHDNYREPGEFGEGATVRRAEPAFDYRTCGVAELAAANPNVMSYIKDRDAEVNRLRELTSYLVTVGGGHVVYGSTEAIRRVQDFILLDSKHPVEKEDVRRSLARSLQTAEEALRKIAAYDDAAANAYLRATGSYRCFDEPGAVELARGVLEGGSC